MDINNIYIGVNDMSYTLLTVIKDGSRKSYYSSVKDLDATRELLDFAYKIGQQSGCYELAHVTPSQIPERAQYII